jgi:acetolactate synthase I/II/III large subunit
MNTAQVLVELLKEYGVEYVFGVPGDTSMALYNAFHATRGEITHVLARDERGASFMADAYARLAYKPGVTEAPSGGGATYVVPGVAEANGSTVALDGSRCYRSYTTVSATWASISLAKWMPLPLQKPLE